VFEDYQKLNSVIGASFARIFLVELMAIRDMSWVNVEANRKALVLFDEEYRACIMQRTW
jgi:hypothetical protein